MDRVFHFRLGADDRQRLDELARRYEVGAAAVVRMLILEKFDGVQRLPPRKT